MGAISNGGVDDHNVGTATAGGGGGPNNIVAASYVIDYVLPASMTIQEACHAIQQCSMMPEPITNMGWTWLAGW